MERAMLVLKTWSVVGERWSRMAVMKVMVSGVGERARGAISRRWDRDPCVYGCGWRFGDSVKWCCVVVVGVAVRGRVEA